MKATMKDRLEAIRITIPVMCGYLFLGTAFGVTLAQAGFGPLWALAMSVFVFAGSLQFVMVPMLAATSFLTVAITAIMVNARHIFYGISYIERFKKMGPLYPYMIFSLSDETYSLYCGMKGDESDGLMFRVGLYDQLYWIIGSVFGCMLSRALPFDLTGIDFSMTALFVVICTERALNRSDRIPLAIGGCSALLFLFLLGPDRFLVPALATTACILVLTDVCRGKGAAA